MRTGVLDTITYDGIEYILKKTRCNKARCSRCPHGPYWYKVQPIGQGRTVLKYVGKNPPNLPQQVEVKGAVLVKKVCPECGCMPMVDSKGIWTCGYCPWWGEHPRTVPIDTPAELSAALDKRVAGVQDIVEVNGNANP